MLPQSFTERMQGLLGSEYEEFLASFEHEKYQALRLNPLKRDDMSVITEKVKQTFQLQSVPWAENGYYYTKEDQPGKHPWHEAGLYYIQEPSAMAPVTLLSPQPGERILDLCAAPGGKSTQIASAMEGEGLLVTNEIHPTRAKILSENVERMGIRNACVLNETPEHLADIFEEYFDRILVDAPCSGEGMFRKEPVARQQHCEALVKQCAELGAQILDCAAAALAPGGQLVYSTCTFAPEEDEGQVAAFLQRHPEFELADALGNVDYTFGSEGEANRTGGLPLDVRKVRRIWPCQGGEGHFMARLVKAGTPRTLLPEGEYTPEEQLWLAAAAQAGKKGKGKAKPAKAADARSTRRADSRACRDAVQGTSRRTRDTGAGEATPAQSLAAWQEFARQYFPALAQRPAVVHGGGVLLPVAFPQTGLHVLRAGVFVGSVQKGRFVPEHHLFTAFGSLCTNCEQLTLADCRCTEYLSGREVEARTAADGWCCVTVDGWPLGGGKVSGGRVKNHYPKALRLL